MILLCIINYCILNKHKYTSNWPVGNWFHNMDKKMNWYEEDIWIAQLTPHQAC